MHKAAPNHPLEAQVITSAPATHICHAQPTDAETTTIAKPLKAHENALHSVRAVCGVNVKGVD
jgi:hypothetical protein